MSGFWELEQRKLRALSGDAKITCTALQYDSRHRHSLTDIHSGTQDRQRTGRDLPTHRITFIITGTEEGIYRELRQLLDVIDSDDNPLSKVDDVWTLQAPIELPLYLWKDEKRAAFTTTEVRTQTIHKSKVEVNIDAVMLGVWVADGGAFCERITGSFEFDGVNYTLSNGVGLPDQDGDNTGTKPLITLPEQTSGYPLAVRASDFAETTPTLDSTGTTVIDGNTLNTETYDLTGFLIPAPLVAGDVGLFEVCSSPTATYLGGGDLEGGVGADFSTFAFNDVTADAIIMYQGASTLDSFAFQDISTSPTVVFAAASNVDTFRFQDTVTDPVACLLLHGEDGTPILGEGGENICTEDGFLYMLGEDGDYILGEDNELMAEK